MKEQLSMTSQEIEDTADLIGVPAAHELLKRRVATLERKIEVLTELVGRRM